MCAPNINHSTDPCSFVVAFHPSSTSILAAPFLALQPLYMCAPCMKYSMRRTPIWSHFSTMQYVCFGCTLPSLATTMLTPCMKRSMRRTPVYSRLSSMQYIHFGCTLPSLATTMCAPYMKCSTRRMPIWSRFSTMQYVCFGCTLPSLATTMLAPCMKRSTRRTPFCCHFSSMQYVCFGRSICTTSTRHLGIRSLLNLHAHHTYSTRCTFRIPPSKGTCQILHITHAPYFSFMICGMPKNTRGDDCKSKSPLHNYTMHYFSMSNIL
jgi:hypothetical protein